MAGRFGPASVWGPLVDGYDLSASKLKALRDKVIATQEETHGLGDSWKERSPTGEKDTELVQEGAFFDTATGSSHDALSGSVPATPQAVARIVCFGYAGGTIGEPFVGLQGTYSHEYEVIAALGELQKANPTYAVSGQRDPGQIIQPLAVQTADWNTEGTGADWFDFTTHQGQIPITSSSVANPTVITCPVPHRILNGQKISITGHTGSTPAVSGTYVATVLTTTTLTVPENVTVGGTGGTISQVDTLNGGVGYLQVSAASGFTNFVGKIRDSPDDVTYADLITFTDNVSAPFAERLTVAGTVDRYTAFDGNVTGAGSITVFCGFSRS
jgi:hypothetical protein